MNMNNFVSLSNDNDICLFLWAHIFLFNLVQIYEKSCTYPIHAGRY